MPGVSLIANADHDADAWTFGYEDVWQTLSTVLDTQVHLDDYRYGLYRALANGPEPKAPEATKLMGFRCGNHDQEGCVTDRQTRLHSCEYGTGCPVWNADFVRITPIISRHDGVEMREAGAGGGKGDLNPRHELELGDVEMMGKLIEAYEAKAKGSSMTLSSIWSKIGSTVANGAQSLSLDIDALGLKSNGGNESQADDFDALEDLPLDKLLPALAAWLQKEKANGSFEEQSAKTTNPRAKVPPKNLPNQIVSLHICPKPTHPSNKTRTRHSPTPATPPTPSSATSSPRSNPSTSTPAR